MSLAFSIIRAADLKAVPWKNGGGATREIAASPKGAAFDAFDWRVSVADVSEAGAFSVFDGIDRVLTLIEGEQMVLIDSEGPEYVLSRWDSVAFAGEASISAELPHGPTRDFNLMSRRDRASGNVTVRRLAEQLDVARGSVVLFAALGAFAVNGERLSPGDAMVFDASENGVLSIEPLSQDAVLIDARIVSKDPGHGLQ
ncbi:MAG: HutD family protein [Pseudomonadota bacterium]|jgi:environmental stress-induced protein Ves|nr:HutD family protein [Pseudomonadota bacterium]